MSNPVHPAPIAIVGLSCRLPGGADSPEKLWENLRSGFDAVSEARGDRWDMGLYHPDESRPRRVYVNAGGFLERVDLFDADFFGMSPREARQVDPQHRLLLELTWEAFEDAGIVPKSLHGSRTGVFVGISSNDYANLDGRGSADAYSNTGSSLSIASNRISYVFDLHGPSMSIDTACSSGLVSLHQACVSLRTGESDVALAGAVNLLISTRPWVGFAKASMLSRSGRCRSFDASGDGYVRSEGGAMVVLKPLAAAERDGDPILGVILGTGVNSDGRTLGLSLPNMDAQKTLLTEVYRDCGVAASDVFYVEAHGTGTAVGDPIECESIGRVLGEPRDDGSVLHIGSIKSNIGHLEPASGIAGLAKMLLAIRHRTIPANLHFDTPNPKILFDDWKLDVVAEALPIPDVPGGVVVGVNSFGFGGTNAHAVLREYRAERPEPPAVPVPDLLMLSAQSPAALRALAEAYEPLVRDVAAADWDRFKATAASCRTHHAHRLVLAAASPVEAADRLRRHLDGDAPSRFASGRAGDASGTVAFVFSGNGPQWWGMGRELLAGSAAFAAEVRAIDAIFVPLSGWSLVAEMARPESESRIALTEVAQPMLFALQAGVVAMLAESGIRPAAVLGHSVGEVAAAYVAGALTREQATHVIYHRSAMQAQTAGLGKMAALGVAADEAQAAIDDAGGWLEIAAVNAPRAVTVAGDPASLERLTARLTESGKFARLLTLDYPFHTRAMDPIRDGLLRRLDGLTPVPATIPFVSTVTGATCDGTALDAAYWFRNVREPVRFADAVDHVAAEQPGCAFLEIGPHPVLRDYVAQTLKARESAAVTLGTLRRPAPGKPESDVDNLWSAVCACHAHGAGDFGAIFARPARPMALPAYPWQRVRHWRGANPLPDTAPPVERDHPLLGYRVSGRDGLWNGALNTQLLPYLVDHVVQGAALFPAAGHIELALAAGRLVHGDSAIDLEGFEILRPLVIPRELDPLIQFGMDAADGTFAIGSRADWDTPEWTDHARGRVSKADHARRPSRLDLSAERAALPVIVERDDHYAGTTARGLAYGPWFSGVRGIRLSSPDASRRRAIGDIAMPDVDTTGYVSHPALLDACLQVLVTLIGQNEVRMCATIPIAVAHVRSHAPLGTELACVVDLERESERSGVATFTICDPAGDVLLELRGARFQKVDFRASVTPLTTEWWRSDAKSVATAGREIAVPFDPAALAPDVARLVAETKREHFYRSVRPRFDRLAAAYAAAALVALDAGPGPFAVRSLARHAGIPVEREPLLARLIELSGEHASGTSDEADDLWRTLAGELPDRAHELVALMRAGESLPALLRSESAGDERRSDAPNGSPPLVEVYHRILATTLAGIVATWPRGRPLRILELGSANGGLTAALLPILSPERVEYVFSDPSEGSVARAKHRFASQRHLRGVVFDVEQPDAASLGGPFDVIVAANAFERALDRDRALDAAASLLVPGGRILALERHPSRVDDIVFGADPAWWDVERDEAPTAAWRERFARAGFGAIAVLDDAVAVPDGEEPQRSVFYAERDASGAALPNRDASPAHANGAARRLLLVVSPGGAAEFASATVDRLREAGHPAEVVVDDGRASDDDLAARLTAAAPDEIVLFAGLDDSQEPSARAEATCLAALRLIRAVARPGADVEPAVTFVTAGGLSSADGGAPVDPAEAPLWGIGRVLANELPTLRIRTIDVRLDAGDPRATALLAETLASRDDETEILLEDGRRYVNRVRPTSFAEQSLLGGTPAPEAYRLDFLPAGGLDSLHLREIERRAPGPGEVEIAVRAAGLNFRDVLWTMGLLPEEAVEHGFSGPTIGMECAGVVARVGDGVEGLAPGDRVIGFASSCFASHVVTSAGSVAPIPAGLDFAAAATIPTAFLTAWYALNHLARIAPGERLLVHGAAGGVGLAALQIAKLRGAEVFGSAGSPEKRRVVELFGADGVVNSRSLDFADAIMRATDGRGVDVVLNSLAGEAITKGLDVLRPFGRFLEIGKRDLYANSRIGLRPFRNNLSYFGIDADTLLVERPDLARACFAEVMDAFARGDLRPLPYETIPVSRAAEAFRAMQQSRHIGKLVVVMDADVPAHLPIVRTASPIGADGTYLVTGGLSGFGLATAAWLVSHGARSLALVGRRGATTDEAVAGIAALEAAGARVRAFAADVTESGDVDRLLAEVRRELPPLRGVFHAAAVIEDAPIVQIDADRLRRVLSPKIRGAWNLHRATLDDRLDAFVLYSSSSVLVGNPGQASYVAANLYLDSLARYRRGRGLPGLSVGFGAIKDAGFLTRNAGVEEILRSRTGMEATPAKEALDDLGRLLAAGATCVTVSQFNLMRLGQSLTSTRSPRFRPLVPEGAGSAASAAGSFASALETMDDAARRVALFDLVRVAVARVLGTEGSQVDPERPLSDMGLDSLMAVELAEGLEAEIARPVSVMQLIQAGTVTAIASAVVRSYAPADEAGPEPSAETRSLAGV